MKKYSVSVIYKIEGKKKVRTLRHPFAGKFIDVEVLLQERWWEMKANNEEEARKELNEYILEVEHKIKSMLNPDGKTTFTFIHSGRLLVSTACDIENILGIRAVEANNKSLNYGGLVEVYGAKMKKTNELIRMTVDYKYATLEQSMKELTFDEFVSVNGNSAKALYNFLTAGKEED